MCVLIHAYMHQCVCVSTYALCLDVCACVHSEEEVRRCRVGGWVSGRGCRSSSVPNPSVENLAFLHTHDPKHKTQSILDLHPHKFKPKTWLCGFGFRSLNVTIGLIIMSNEVEKKKKLNSLKVKWINIHPYKINHRYCGGQLKINVTSLRGYENMDMEPNSHSEPRNLGNPAQLLIMVQ